MAGNPTGAMGVPDYLGWDWKSKAGIPIVCVPGCPIQPDNLSETILYLLYQAAGQAPDDPARRGSCGRPGCSAPPCTRAATAPATTSRATSPPSTARPKCIVKLGCWGPVVKCNVPKRGWINGVGGCPNVGGICIGCTMPGFPDKFMPFMDEPPGSKVSTAASTRCTARVIRTLRGFTAQHRGQGAEVAHAGRRAARPATSQDLVSRDRASTLTARRTSRDERSDQHRDEHRRSSR